MATGNTPLEFDGEERQSVAGLALTMKAAAGVLLLLAAVFLIGGFLGVAAGAPREIVSVIEGAVTGVFGLILLACAGDVHYSIETKFTALHLRNAFRNLTVLYRAQFVVLVFFILVALFSLLADFSRLSAS